MTKYSNSDHYLDPQTGVLKNLLSSTIEEELEKADFCERAAFYLGEINALHPFREGNGRAQREFISHLAYANGYHIEWKNSDQEAMVAATIRANIRGIDKENWR
jgi:cell filamentation protein